MEAAVEAELAAEAAAAAAEAERARQAIAAKQQELLDLEQARQAEVGGWEGGRVRRRGWRGGS
jgi:hypothetical protein